MNDDRLRTELQRRAESAEVPSLLPAVRHAIDTRPQPVGVSRWRPLAGLAGVAALILLLVVALPRLAPAPAATTAASGVATMPSLLDCGSLRSALYYESSPVYVVDEVGVIESCAAEPLQGPWTSGDANVVVQAVGDAADQLEVAWRRSQLCGPERILIEVASTGDRYSVRLILDRSGPYGYECGEYAIPEHAVLSLTKPIDPAQVSVDTLTVPDPTAPLRRLQQTFACSPEGPNAGNLPTILPQIVDHTGVVTGCRQVAPNAPVRTGVAVANSERLRIEPVRLD